MRDRKNGVGAQSKAAEVFTKEENIGGNVCRSKQSTSIVAVLNGKNCAYAVERNIPVLK